MQVIELRGIVKMKCQLTVLLLCFVIICGQKVSQSQEMVFYQKVLPDKRKIIVICKPTAYEAPSKEAKAKLQKEFPGASYVDAKPESSNEYSLFLTGGGAAKRALLWQKKVVEFTFFGRRDPSFKIYDIAFSSNTLIVVYRVSSFVFAEVITTPFPNKNQTIQRKFILLQESNETEPGSIETATLESGSPDKKLLSITLKSSLSGSYRFSWQNGEWIPQKTDQPKILFAKSYSSGRKNWQLDYSVNPSASQTETFEDKREVTYQGTLLSLRKAPLSADDKVDIQKATVLRQSFFIPNPVKPPQWWSGDAVTDEETRKAYIVLADGSKFWLQIISLDETLPKKLQTAPNSPANDIQELIDRKDVTIEPDTNVVKSLPFINAISLEKVGDDLIVSLNGSYAPQDQWTYSLIEETWSKAKP